MTRLFQCPPQGVNLETDDRVHVIEDSWEMFPSFFNVLFTSLDYSLVLLYAMLFMFFDAIPGTNSLLSVFCIYIIQAVLVNVRSNISSKNISKKSYIDDCFLK
jgi:Meckelin (Transmembrane protein 67)